MSRLLLRRRRVRALLGHDATELLHHRARLRKSARVDLGVQAVAVVGDLEGVDRLERLREDIHPIDCGSCSHLILVHCGKQPGGRTANRAAKLLTEEEEDGSAGLQSSDGTHGVLDRLRGRVRPALDLEAGEGLLQLRRSAAELAVDLSGGAEFDSNRAVKLLDCWCVVLCSDVPLGDVDLLFF